MLMEQAHPHRQLGDSLGDWREFQGPMRRQGADRSCRSGLIEAGSPGADCRGLLALDSILDLTLSNKIGANFKRGRPVLGVR
jgi:hypothetical protein